MLLCMLSCMLSCILLCMLPCMLLSMLLRICLLPLCWLNQVSVLGVQPFDGLRAGSSWHSDTIGCPRGCSCSARCLSGSSYFVAWRLAAPALFCAQSLWRSLTLVLSRPFPHPFPPVACTCLCTSYYTILYFWGSQPPAAEMVVSNSAWLLGGMDMLSIYCSPFLGGYGARTRGVFKHHTLHGIIFFVDITDQCRCRLQMCDDAGRADAVDMTMLHAILRQCRQKSMRSVWQA